MPAASLTETRDAGAPAGTQLGHGTPRPGRAVAKSVQPASHQPQAQGPRDKGAGAGGTGQGQSRAPRRPNHLTNTCRFIKEENY